MRGSSVQEQKTSLFNLKKPIIKKTMCSHLYSRFRCAQLFCKFESNVRLKR